MLKRTRPTSALLAVLTAAGLLTGIEPAFAAPQPTAPTPSSASNNDAQSANRVLTVGNTGDAFQDGATVTLFRSGYTDIPGTNVTVVPGGSSLSATFNISQSPPGAWSLRVTNPDTSTGSCSSCFTITGAAPSISSVTPTTRGRGFTGDVFIAGSNFWQGATVTFSGSGITLNSTTRTSSSQLRANITVTSSASTTARNVIVTNANDTSATCTACFTVNEGPVPTGAAPAAAVNTAPVVVTISGSGFAAGAVPRLRRAGQPDIVGTSITVISSTSLRATFDVTDEAPGPWTVMVENTDAGMGTCACFSVAANAPTVAGVSPPNRGQGATDQNLTVTGTSFAKGVTASISGGGVNVNSTTFVSRTQITVNVDVTGVAAGGARDVTVTNTDMQADVCAGCFTVDPTPTLDTATPASRGQGATSEDITLAGTGFLPTADVTFSGAGITVNSVTHVSGSELTVNVSVDPAAATGARDITVDNANAGNTVTCVGCFTVAPAPTVGSAAPSSRGQGAANQSIVVTGTGFLDGAVASFSGSGITVNSTTRDNATTLTVDATIAPGAGTGARDVLVTNGDGGKASCSGCFTVNALPSITSLSPDDRGQGASSQTITATGTGFVATPTVTFSGTGITVNSTTFVNATTLSIDVSVAADAPVGARDVTVTNPDQGTSTCSGCFTVNVAPTATGVAPSSRGQGATNQDLTIAGTDLLDGATVSFSGAGITVNSTTFVDDTTLTVNVSIDGAAATGSRNVTVQNPDGATAAVCTACFTVDATPTATAASPSSRGQGAAAQDVTITGTSFLDGATVSFSGSGITVNSTTFDSATALTANITVSAGAATGARDVTVQNPNGGTAAVCTGCFTVNARPTVTGAAPPTRGQGSAAHNISVTGTAFVTGAQASISGAGVTVNSTTFVNSTTLTVNVTVDEAAATGARDITILNPDLGAGTCVGCFTVSAKPTATSAEPASLGQGASGHDVVVSGSGFSAGVSSSFSGTGVTVNSTTFLDATTVRINVTIDPAAALGARDISVSNSDGGTAVCTGCFAITTDPVVNSITPGAAVNTSTVNTTISGGGFQNGAVVFLRKAGQDDILGSNVVVGSSSSITARFNVTNAAPGAWRVWVQNPDTASGSCACFTIAASTPTVADVSPDARARGLADQDITITGTSFAKGAAATFSGTGITVNSTEFVSPSTVVANITIAEGAPTGTRNVTVTNTDTQAATCTDCLAINPAVTITSLTPDDRGQGAANQSITVTGTGFASGVTVGFSGTGITVNSTTLDSPTQLTLDVTIAADAPTGTRSVTVNNTDGGSDSCDCFTVNPGLSVSSLDPTALGQGASSQQISVVGEGFTAGTTGSFSGAGVTVDGVTVDSPTEITLTVSVTGAAAPGNRTLTLTAADGGMATCPDCFTVNAAATIIEVDPDSRGQGASSQTLSIKGTGILNDATAAISGSGITITSTTWVASDELQIQIDVADDAPTGARDVSIDNADGSPAVVCTGCFTINAGPTIDAPLPTSRGQGAEAQSVTVSGTGFQAGATAAFSGTGVTVNSVTFVSAAELTLDVSIATDAPVGLRSLTVTNPDAGQVGCTDCFTVNAAPSIIAFAPDEIGQGAQNVDATLTGSGFTAASVVSIGGSSVTINSTTFVSGNELALDLSVDPAAVAAARDITVTNDDGSPAEVCSGCLTINPAPTISSVSPGEVYPGAKGQVLAFTGTGFADGLELEVSSGDVAVTDVAFVDASNATATVDIAPGATLADLDLTITNADRGPGTCAACLTIVAAPTNPIDTTESITGKQQVSFQNSTRNVTSQNVVLRVVGSSTNLPGSLICRNASGGAVDCATGDVRNVSLTPSDHLLPGQMYRLIVNPAGASPSTDANGSAQPSVGETFRASTMEQENSVAGVPRWRWTRNSEAYGGSENETELRGASASFEFSGNKIRWYTTRGPKQGRTQVLIDGVDHGTFDLYGSSWQYKVARTFEVPDGDHVIKLIARGNGRGGARTTVDAFRVAESGSWVLYQSPVLRFLWGSVSNSNASGNRFMRERRSGAWFSMSFAGTGVDWYTVAGPKEGKADLFIDGEFVKRIDNYRSSNRYDVRRKIRGLSDGIHTLRIKVLQKRNRSSSGTWVSVDRIGII